MQPSKYVDYMSELNRLFPKTTENAIQTPNNSFQTFNHPVANFSSSSADSFSPESLPDPLYNRHDTFGLPDTPKAINDSLFSPIARRPIIGRKFQGHSEYRPIEQSNLEHLNFEPNSIFELTNYDARKSPIRNTWPNESLTPPKLNSTFIEQKNYTQNVFYDVFPDENKSYGTKTPVKNPSIMPNYLNISPSSVSHGKNPSIMSNYSNISPSSISHSKNPSIMSNYSNISPSSSISHNSLNSGIFSPPRTFPISLGAVSVSSSFHEVRPPKMCTFCRKNGETPLVYMTHVVKEKRGNRNIVTCPILRSHVCSTCGESGDNAHTITYCPILRSNNNGLPLKSTTITLKNTRIKSNGRRRY